MTRCDMTTSRQTRGNQEEKWTTGGGAEAACQEIKRRWWHDNRGNRAMSKGEDMVEVVRIWKCGTGWYLHVVKILLLYPQMR
jgi:hypothetical protein